MARVLIISNSDTHGDGIAAFNLSRCLLEAGFDVAMVVSHRTRPDAFVYQAIPASKSIIVRLFERAHRLVQSKRQPFELDKKYDFVPYSEAPRPVKSTDILNATPFIPDLIVSGLTSNFISTQVLAELHFKSGAPVYLLSVDMAPLTGGCHHAWDCEGYKTDCSNCPAILDQHQKDHAAHNLAIKRKFIHAAGIKIIGGSGRTLMQAQQSALFKEQKVFYNINSFIDLRTFNSKNRAVAKQVFDVPSSYKTIFTGSEYNSNPRKGVQYFIEALQLLWNDLSPDEREHVCILVAGKSDKGNDFSDQIPFRKVFIPFITDERLLSLAYQASDVFVCPSIEDPGPLMVSQALACGTPVVGFEMGILYNMVVNGFNGYKARLRDVRGLANGIKNILFATEAEFNTLSLNGIRQVEQHSSTQVAIEIIRNIIEDER